MATRKMCKPRVILATTILKYGRSSVDRSIRSADRRKFVTSRNRRWLLPDTVDLNSVPFRVEAHCAGFGSVFGRDEKLSRHFVAQSGEKWDRARFCGVAIYIRLILPCLPIVRPIIFSFFSFPLNFTTRSSSADIFFLFRARRLERKRKSSRRAAKAIRYAVYVTEIQKWLGERKAATFRRILPSGFPSGWGDRLGEDRVGPRFGGMEANGAYVTERDSSRLRQTDPRRP